ncbi:hypothetical protein BH10ACI1_BH10ACI1_09600 [soil metagenome]
MGRAKRWRVKNLPEKLLQIRKNLNLSQNELIRELRLENVIYQTNISVYESGEREPPLPILLRYARLAKINLENLVDDDL